MIRRWNRIVIVVVAIFVGVFLVLVFGSVKAGTSRSVTCVICRLGRTETTLFGWKRSTYQENECSLWYPKNVEPTHTHIWEEGTCTTLLNALGQPIGVGCRPGHYPILGLSPSTQMSVYKHFEDRQEAKELFSNLTDAKTYDDRLDEHDESNGHLIVSSIEDWQIAGFPGTWDEWWHRWWKNHVAEHNEWLDWLHSDSKTSFWDWKERQKATLAPATKISR
jgi:hypothetical protein